MTYALAGLAGLVGEAGAGSTASVACGGAGAAAGASWPGEAQDRDGDQERDHLDQAPDQEVEIHRRCPLQGPRSTVLTTDST